jgi:hypothetical protein
MNRFPLTPTSRLQKINKQYFPDKPVPVTPKRELAPSIVEDIQALFILCAALAVFASSADFFIVGFGSSGLFFERRYDTDGNGTIRCSSQPKSLCNLCDAHFLVHDIEFSKEELHDAIASCGLHPEELDDLFTRCRAQNPRPR